MADGAVYVRVWGKLIPLLDEPTKSKLCGALLDVQINTVNNAITAIREGDYRAAHELTAELYDVITKYKSLGSCEREGSGARPPGYSGSTNYSAMYPNY